MANLKANLRARCYRKWHSAFTWWALAVLIIWALSGFLHPLMSWFGPQIKQFYPPKLQLEQVAVQQLPEQLNGILLNETADLSVMKVVPSEQGSVLQVTDNELKREYFSLALNSENLTSPEESFSYNDQQQAIWLASHYSGLGENKIESIELISEFSLQYPSVNRLLPVYKIQYATEDSLTVFIHTETSALAGVNNNFKRVLQSVFQQLHTFKFLNDFEWGRLIIIALMMLLLMAMAVTGIALVLLIKSRKKIPVKRKVHRVLAYVLWLPLLAWSFSGFYHLLQSSLLPVERGMRLMGEFNFQAGGGIKPDQKFEWLSQLKGKTIREMSIISTEEFPLLYRVAYMGQRKEVNREKRFSGAPVDKGSIYVNAISGEVLQDYNDKDHVDYLVKEKSNIITMNPITRFGPQYDFRNKRLPVWQVEFDDADNTMWFVDPATHILVEQTKSIHRVESYSFSFLHKWNFLRVFMDRFSRDMIIEITLLLLVLLSVMGGVIHFRRS